MAPGQLGYSVVYSWINAAFTGALIGIIAALLFAWISRFLQSALDRRRTRQVLAMLSEMEDSGRKSAASSEPGEASTVGDIAHLT